MDWFQVVKRAPNDQDAKLKFNECQKLYQKRRFEWAIRSEEKQTSIFESLNPETISEWNGIFASVLGNASSDLYYLINQSIYRSKKLSTCSAMRESINQSTNSLQCFFSWNFIQEFDSVLICPFLAVEDSYTGPRLVNGKVTSEFMDALLSYFKDQKILHRRFATEACLTLTILIRSSLGDDN